MDADSDIDMGSAQDEISTDLFGASEPENYDIEDTAENEDSPEDSSEEEPEDSPEEEPEEEPQVRSAPQSWKKEMHEAWSSLDPSIQDYIEQRESEMRNGLDINKEDSTLGRTVRDTLSNYGDLIQQQGIDENTLIHSLLNMHGQLSTASPEERANVLNKVAQAYGIESQPEYQDENLQALQNKVAQMEQYINASYQQTQQAEREKTLNEVEEFASKNPYFDEVANEITNLITAGYSLDEAYQHAIWMNPSTRQKELERQAKEESDKKAQEAKQAASKARKAKSANVKSRDTNTVPTEPLGSMEDTMRETFREINNR